MTEHLSSVARTQDIMLKMLEKNIEKTNDIEHCSTENKTRIVSLQAEITEHKANHWQSISLAVAIVGILAGLAGYVFK